MARVEFFYDFVSPYSYLAATQIEALCKRAAAQLAWRPFLLGAVMKATGNSPPASVAGKARWILGDLSRWARSYGVPYAFPALFPANSLRALRLAFVADAEGRIAAYSHAVFRAYWVEGRDIGTDEVLRSVLTEVGLDATQALHEIEQPAIKEALRRSTDEAVLRGAFGAPAIFVGDDLFWGNDRLPFVEAALCGEK